MKLLSRSPELPSSRTARWLYALKPASWPKLLVPTLLGQALGAFSAGALRGAAVIWGIAFTLAGLGFIVLVNDWGDRHVDTLKRAMFPDSCSPKTIPDRILSETAVGLAGLSLALVTLLIGAGSEVALGRPWGFEAAAICVAVFAAYTLPPIRLNYRGGGEVLEMIGVGVALPLYNAYLQAGFVVPGLWPWVVGFAFLSLGSGVASGLSDEESDRRGGKRTVASVFGNQVARAATEASVVVGGSVWVLGAVLEPDWVPPWAVLPAIAILAWHVVSLRKASSAAATNAFPAQGHYKHLLHSAIWHSTSVAAVVLWLHLAVS